MARKKRTKGQTMVNKTLQIEKSEPLSEIWEWTPTFQKDTTFLLHWWHLWCYTIKWQEHNLIWNRVQHKYTLKKKQRSMKTVFKHVNNNKNIRHHILSRVLIALFGNNDGIYSFQENSLVYVITMMVYILFRRIPRFIC